MIARFGRYEAIEVLGRGGMGVVYRGVDPEIGRAVAVKTVLLDEAEGGRAAELRERLIREVKAAGTLQHPNIITVHDVGVENGAPYIVMELIQGRGLDKVLEERMLPVDESLRILRDTAGALDFAHARGVIHRDIKPSNILIASDGTVKLVDFGIAKVAGTETITEKGAVIGSLPFMAPESLRGEPPSASSDRFSLAVMAYSMLTGRRPFQAEAIEALIVAILTADPRPASEANPWLPAGVDAVLARGLAKSAAARYESCAAFVNALERACRPVEEPQPERQAPSPPPSPQVPLKSPAEELPPTVVAQAPSLPRPDSSGRPANPTASAVPEVRSPFRSPRTALLAGVAAAGVAVAGWLIWTKFRSEPNCEYALSQSETIPPAGRQVKVPVTTAAGCPWTAATDAPWLSITSAAGKGNGDLVYTVARNESPAPRTGTIVIGGQTHRVTQAGAPTVPDCRYQFDPPAMSTSSAATNGRVNVNTGAGCSWTASTNADWLTLVSPSGRGAGVLVFNAGASNTPAARTGTITIGSSTFTITQGAGVQAPVTGTVRENPRNGLKYVWIPPGRFRMGCSANDTECDNDEKPARDVRIARGFWIGQTEVTQEAYQKIKGTNPSNFKGSTLPVEQVSWTDANGYCEAVGMRLPTEAEWEYAARGGSTAARYGALGNVAWYRRNSGSKTHPVAQKQPNGFALYDVLGNVWEWVADWYDAKYYASGAVQDPRGPANGQMRVVRGGSWLYLPRFVRLSDRERNEPSYRYSNFGFRCAGELR